jgi:two-component system, NarL family, sensor kinase
MLGTDASPELELTLTDLLPRTGKTSSASQGQRRRARTRRIEDRRGFWRGRPVVQFITLGTLVLIALVLATFWLAGRAAGHEAVNDARSRSVFLERAVVAQEMPPGLVASQPAAVAAFDRVVHRQVLGGWLVRVKIWDASSRIVYSDEPRLIGRQFALEPDALQLLHAGASGAVVGRLSDLTEPENRYERSFGKLYEAYTVTRSPEGQPLLFEAYFRYSDLTHRSDQILGQFLPISIGGLLIFVALTIPLVWRLASRARRAREERERLLRRAVDASDAERRRIAADLHDGVVQELAGASFALAAASKRIPEAPAVSASLDRVAAGLRQSMRSLRSLLVEIYPPNLHTEGLAAALGDLLAPLPGTGLTTSLEVPEHLDLPPDVAAIVFRVAQEAIRNTQRHASAELLTVSVQIIEETVVLTITDDGVGFEPARKAAEGHVGLRLLADLAAEAGGRFEVRSTPGTGTVVRLDVPLGTSP